MDKTNLITLFHKEAQPMNIMRHMVRRWGWKDANGRMSFCHTIPGRSNRFKVEDDAGRVIVKPLRGNGPVSYWTQRHKFRISPNHACRLYMKKERFTI